MSIIVYKKDGSRFESNNVIGVGFFGDQLVIIMHGIIGGIDSRKIDGVEIGEVKIVNN